jgi:hypothetical protein
MFDSASGIQTLFDPILIFCDVTAFLEIVNRFGKYEQLTQLDRPDLIRKHTPQIRNFLSEPCLKIVANGG